MVPGNKQNNTFWDGFPSQVSPNYALRGAYTTKMAALEICGIGASLSVCTFPIVEKISYEIRPRMCVFLSYYHTCDAGVSMIS